MHCGTLVLRSAATRTGGIGLGAACRFHVALGASAAISGPATAVISAAPGRTVITTPTSAATSAADPAQCAPAVTAWALAQPPRRSRSRQAPFDESRAHRQPHLTQSDDSDAMFLRLHHLKS
jgi:hypothetical protein